MVKNSDEWSTSYRKNTDWFDDATKPSTELFHIAQEQNCKLTRELLWCDLIIQMKKKRISLWAKLWLTCLKNCDENDWGGYGFH